MRALPCGALVTVLVALPCHAYADDEAPTSSTRATPPEPPFRYSIPWQLRPLPAPTVLRLDNVIAFDENTRSQHGATFVSFLTAAARVSGTGPPRAGLDLVLRGGFVADGPPSGAGASAIANALVGAAYAIRLPKGFLLNFFLGLTVPVGSGGGDVPEEEKVVARSRAAAARSQLDNPILAANDFGVAPGLGVGWVERGWTVQLEATFAHAVRVRGAQAQREAAKTNSTFAAHVGYFVLPFLSLNTELRYQRWLNAPFSVDADPTGDSRDNLTFAVGPRFHIDAGAGWLRPGIAYARALDKPMAAAAPNLHIVQIDVPFFF